MQIIIIQKGRRKKVNKKKLYQDVQKQVSQSVYGIK